MTPGFLAAFLRGFRRVMPRDARFVACFCRHSALLVPAARAFRELMSEGRDPEHCFAEIDRLEEEADKITGETVRAAHRSFVTPFDRSQILDLIGALDDTIDLMKETGRRIRLYRIDFTPEMRGMGDCIIRAVQELDRAMPLLEKIDRNVAELGRISIQVREIESEADRLLEQGLVQLFSNAGDSPGRKLTIEKVYDLIEAVIDRCEDVADVIDGIVVEQV